MKSLYEQFKGKYRVKAHYDLGTGDFIRSDDGELDPDFDDFYLECENNDEIHSSDDENILVGYIWDLERGADICRKIKEIDKKAILKTEKTDGEVLIWFNVSYIDIVAKEMGAYTTFSKRNPFDERNLKQ